MGGWAFKRPCATSSKALTFSYAHKCIEWEMARAQETHEALHVVSVGLVTTAVGRKALDRVPKKMVY